MANLLNLECDAWLLPTSRTVGIRDDWLPAHDDLRGLAERSADFEFRAGTKLAQAIQGWPPLHPLPVLTSVTVNNEWPEGALEERIDAFVTEALDGIKDIPRQRPLPLLAVPFFGTAGGGAGRHLGGMLTSLLAVATRLSRRHQVDLVIVLKDKAAFSLAQKLRREKVGTSWASLTDEQLAQASKLGNQAKLGALVPFLGAGVSISAGGPSWSMLIDRLSEQIDLAGLDMEEFKKLPVLDQAGILERLFIEQDHPSGFRRAVCDEVGTNRYGLAPTLLATLPCKGAITLNFDSLFEDACNDAGVARSVIPDNKRGSGDRWLLKLHGSVTDPAGIVLTREDYLDHNTNRQSLSALVKAHLLTDHMLFVGFGLADDHFHEIVHDVKRALPSESNTGPQRFGTVLSLNDDSLQRRVWDNELEFLSVADIETAPTGDELTAAPDIHRAGRKLEVFLDALNAYATDTHSYLLSPLYTSGLSGEELRLRTQLLALADEDRTNKTSEIWTVLRGALEDLGWDSNGEYQENEQSGSAVSGKAR